MRKIRSDHILATLAVAGLVLLGASPALAQKAKSTQNEAEFVEFDPAASTVTLKVLKPGKGPGAKELPRGKDVTFNVIPTGSVLTRTSVTVNSQKAELTDIPAGKTVNVYWVPDPNKKGEYFARKIDVVLSEEELDRRYEVVE